MLNHLLVMYGKKYYVVIILFPVVSEVHGQWQFVTEQLTRTVSDQRIVTLMPCDVIAPTQFWRNGQTFANINGAVYEVKPSSDLRI